MLQCHIFRNLASFVPRIISCMGPRQEFSLISLSLMFPLFHLMFPPLFLNHCYFILLSPSSLGLGPRHHCLTQRRRQHHLDVLTDEADRRTMHIKFRVIKRNGQTMNLTQIACFTVNHFHQELCAINFEL